MTTIKNKKTSIPIMGEELMWADDPFDEKDFGIFLDEKPTNSPFSNYFVFGKAVQDFSKGDKQFELSDCQGNKQIVQMDSKKTLFEYPIVMKDEEIAVWLSNIPGGSFAYLIVKEDTGKMMQCLPVDTDYRDFLTKFKMLDQAKKQALKEMTVSGDDGAKEESLTRFTTASEHRLLFEVQRNHFSKGLQNEIEMLIKAESVLSRRNNDSRRLNYILNITNNHPKNERKFSRQSQLECLKRRVVSNEKLLKKLAGKDDGCLLLYGPQGSGKRTIANAIAEIRKLPIVKLNLRGISSSNSIIGDAPGYSDGEGGIILKGFYNVGTTRCIVLLEGIEGMSQGTINGNIYETLAGVLHGNLTDNFLQMPIDVSNTLFIATANSIEDIPYCLMNCFEGNCFEMEQLSDEEKMFLLKREFTRLSSQQQLTPFETINITDEALKIILEDYTCDKGMEMALANLKTVFDEAFEQTRKAGKHAVITGEFVHNQLEKEIDEKQLKWAFLRHRSQYSAEDCQFISNQIEAINLRGSSDEELKKWKDYFEKLNKGLFNTHEQQLQPQKILEELRQDHSCMDALLQRMVEKLYSNSLSVKQASTRFLLYGPAGTGKSSLALSLAEATNRELIRISLNGQYDSQYLKGSERDAGILLKKLALAKKGIVVLLDEIEKANTLVQDSLLDILDGNSSYIDQFYRISLDLSNVIFIATANKIDNLPPWLLDRFETIEMSSYNKGEKKIILEGHLLPKYNRKYANAHIEMDESAKGLFLHYFENNGGIRQPDELLGKLIEQKIYHQQSCDIEIDDKDVLNYMGPLPYQKGNLPLDRHCSGFVQGLSVSGNSGIVFSIETLILPDPETNITGSAEEDVCQCVSIAHSYIRKNYPQYGDFGYHIHFGEESIKKSGPSAGVAILISMLSALSGQSVQDNCAFTGEMSLLGGIYPVGGVKEKISAAVQAGCHKVYIPSENYLRLDDMFLQQCKINIIPCDNVRQVIDDVLNTNNLVQSLNRKA